MRVNEGVCVCVCVCVCVLVRPYTDSTSRHYGQSRSAPTIIMAKAAALPQSGIGGVKCFHNPA